MGGVDSLPLGGEGVLDVGEAQVAVLDVLSRQLNGVTVLERQRDMTLRWINPIDLGSGSVPQARASAVTGERAADLDLIALVQLIRPSGGRQALCAEFACLDADGLGACVELVEVLVGRLDDDKRVQTFAAVRLSGLESSVLCAALLGAEVNVVAGGVAAEAR